MNINDQSLVSSENKNLCFWTIMLSSESESFLTLTIVGGRRWFFTAGLGTSIFIWWLVPKEKNSSIVIVVKRTRVVGISANHGF